MPTVSRRDFLRGAIASLGFVAIPGTACFAAPPGWRPKGRASLVFGFITDTHTRRDGDPAKERVWPRWPTTNLESAFTFFRDQEVDAVVCGGDMAHRGLRCELQFTADAWWKIFPNDRLPNGRPVERIFVTGNHEWFRNDPFSRQVYPDPETRERNVLANDMARHWEEVWHEPYERVWQKTVKGYHFFGEHFEDRFGEMADLILSREKACRLKGRKPFFMLYHMIPTPEFCRKLANFPNAFMLFGHWHNSTAHLGTLYHREFPMLNGPSLRTCGAQDVPGYRPDMKTRCKGDEIQHGYLFRVYSDLIVMERHDFRHGGKTGPDLVLPLGRQKVKPFSPEGLRAAFGTPAFPPRTTLTATLSEENLTVSIPPASANHLSRPYLYDITVEGADDPPKNVCIYAAGCDFAETHPRALAPTVYALKRTDLPPGEKWKVTVRPVSSLGDAGAPIATTV